MDILQTWIRLKGDGAALALDAHFRTLGWDSAALLAAIAAERKSQILDELATKRKEAEAAGVSKGEWEKIEPKLAESVEPIL